jgi:hypothetical protein
MEHFSRRGFLRTALSAGAAVALGSSLVRRAIAEMQGAEPIAAAAGRHGAVARAWRPFSELSPFNTPIPADAPLHPDSEAMVRSLLVGRGSSAGRIHVNIQSWSIPVFEPPVGAEMKEIVCDRQAYSGSASVRCPVWPALKPDPMADAHMVIVGRKAGREWDFFGARWQDGQLRTKAASEVDLAGDGLVPAGGCRLVGFALLSGLIRPEEIEGGVIDHALVFADEYVGPAVWPATRGGGQRQPEGTLAVPAGGCVQLDPAVDVDALDLPPAGKMIARALQKYGMYNSDFAGGLVVYAENPLGRASDPWAKLGFDNAAATGIPVARMRVVQPEAIRAEVDRKRKAAEGAAAKAAAAGGPADASTAGAR